jgi:hypothetical protein
MIASGKHSFEILSLEVRSISVQPFSTGVWARFFNAAICPDKLELIFTWEWET